MENKRKQQYIKAYCLMYPWYLYEEYCEYVHSVSFTSPKERQKPDNGKHGRHCLRWLLDVDVSSMSEATQLSEMVKPKRRKKRF